jgi:N-methylhydantoinase A
MPRILVPAMPGVLAALGAVQSDLTATRVHSVLRRIDESAGVTDAVRASLLAVAAEAEDALDDERAETSHALDLRYTGQSYELTIDVLDPHATDFLDRAGRAFHAAHEQRFGHADPQAALEVVNARAVARVPSATPLPVPAPGEGVREHAAIEVVFDGLPHVTSVYHREDFRPGDRIDGPAIVTQLDTTTLIEPGWRATADGQGNLLLERTP